MISASRSAVSGGLCRRLEYDSAAGGQRRADLPGGHRGGEVPRRHEQGHADGLPQDHDLVGAGGGGLNLAPQPDGLLGVPAEEVRRVQDLTARVRESLAVLGGDQEGQLVHLVDHRLVDAPEDFGPLARWRGRPPGGRVGCGVDAGQRVLDGSAGDRGQRGSGRRVDHVEGGSVRGIAPLPIDEQLRRGRLHDGFHRAHR